MRQFINMVRASLVVSLVLFVQSHNVYAVQELVVMCPAYEWQGQRVGFYVDTYTNTCKAVVVDLD